jgi:hypothetical protein
LLNKTENRMRNHLFMTKEMTVGKALLLCRKHVDRLHA